MDKDLCKQCGKCCYYGKNYKKPCAHLNFWAGKYFCDIYNHRLGAKMGTEHNIVYYCGRRGIDEQRLIDGCPYNELIKMPNHKAEQQSK